MVPRDYSGVELCSRYSRVPNSLGFCGPSDVQDSFLKCILEKECDDARSSLAKFEGLYPYLDFISGKHGRDPFDPEVVEAYWLGNKLLDGFSRAEFSGHLDRLVSVGLPSFLADKLKKNLPEAPFPSHLFNVVFVGVGNITGSVLPNIENMDNCRVSCVEVVEVRKTALFTKHNPLVKKGESLAIGKDVEKKINYDSRLFRDLSAGDFVSVHWNHACEQLSNGRKRRLEEYTERVLGGIQCFHA
ncbi:hypothetical protein HYU11_01820 [Candidatus Woesearchaeota archaeon]|nr:hypothetical protein [Candidatus Woesearchaeota archaeon]